MRQFASDPTMNCRCFFPRLKLNVYSQHCAIPGVRHLDSSNSRVRSYPLNRSIKQRPLFSDNHVQLKLKRRALHSD